MFIFVTDCIYELLIQFCPHAQFESCKGIFLATVRKQMLGLHQVNYVENESNKWTMLNATAHFFPTFMPRPIPKGTMGLS